MLKRIIFSFFLFVSICASAQQVPAGFPSPYSTNYYRVGFLQEDSGGIYGIRDTTARPRFAGFRLLWPHAGSDTSVWVFNGSRYVKELNYQDTLGNRPLVTKSFLGSQGYIKNITGFIQQGSNVTISGSGTLVSPYVINASGSGATGITQLTGDGTTGTGGGSQALTLATVNTGPGSFGDASHVADFTVNGKGLVTVSGQTSIQIAESQVSNLVSDLAGKQPLITTGSTSQYIRGDGSLATFPNNLSAFSNGPGYITANQPISFTASGDINGTFTNPTTLTPSLTINPNVVSYSKIQAAAGQGLMGAQSAGNFQLVTIGTGLIMSGGVLSATGSGTSTGVDTIWRTPGKDSIQYTINGRYHSVLDSAGGGITQLFAKSPMLILGTDTVVADTTAGNQKLITQGAVARGYQPIGNYLTNVGNIGSLFTSGLSGTTISFTATGQSAYSFYGNATNSTGPASMTKIPYQAFAPGTANTLLGFDGSTNPTIITLTTTGSSGPATISGGVLNIPQYSGGGSGNTNSNVGTGYRWVFPNTNNIRTFFVSATPGFSVDSTVNSNGLTLNQQAANTSQNGYLSSTDWNTFNGKQGALTFTTTGSGPASLIGTTLNVPQPITSKGDIIVGIGGNAYTRLGVGPDGAALIANSAQSTGLNWVQQLVTYNVFNFGAFGDCQLATDATMLSGTNTVQSQRSTFVSGDVGKIILIKGAGAGGLDTLTTITGFTDAHHITVAINASTTASGIIKWGHDDTPAFQAAINAAFANHGGEVIVPILNSHMYMIAGPLIHSDNLGHDPNSQIYFPSQNFPELVDSVPVVIKITGQIKPTTEFSALDNDSSQIYNSGCILESVLTANYGQGSVIGTAFGVNTGFGQYSALTPLIENLYIRVPDGINGAYRSGFDFIYAQGEQAKNFVVTSDVPMIKTHGPAAGYHTFGFRGTASNGGTEIHLDGVNLVSGLEVGYILGEHTTCFNLQASGCLKGVELAQSFHANHLSTVKAQWCKYAVAADSSGLAFVQIDQLDVEGLHNGNWFDYSAGILDNSHIRGSIGYFFNPSTLGTATTWSVSGNTRANISLLGNPLISPYTFVGGFSGNTASTVPGVAGFNNPVLELWDNTSTSGVTDWAQLVLSTTQTGPSSKPIGDLLFVNRSNNVRLGLIESLTDGATNSGNLTTYVSNAGTLTSAQSISHIGQIGFGQYTTATTFYKQLDTTNYKLMVKDASGNMWWTNWPTFGSGGGSQTLTYTQAALNNTLSISGGNTQTFLTATQSLAGLLDTGRAKSIDSLRNGTKTFNLFAANGLSASTVIADSFYLGGTLIKPTTVNLGGNNMTFSRTAGTDTLFLSTGVLLANPVTAVVHPSNYTQIVGGLALGGWTRYVPTANNQGFSCGGGGCNSEYIFDPATGSFTNISFGLDNAANLPDGFVYILHFGGTITSGAVFASFSVTDADGTAFIQNSAPSTPSAGDCVIYKLYKGATNYWYRE